jgi:hypothetical protein
MVHLGVRECLRFLLFRLLLLLVSSRQMLLWSHLTRPFQLEKRKEKKMHAMFTLNFDSQTQQNSIN